MPSQQEDATTRFLRAAGRVNDDGKNPILRFPPARWVVSIVQYLIAIVVLTIVEGFKAVVSGGSRKRRDSATTR